MLTCTDIHKAYGDTEVLRGISARFEPGTITSIIGPSGTGKSTLLRILSMLEDADGGSVSFEDTTVSYPRPETEAEITPPWPRLTTVFQQLFLWPHLTIRENICLPVRNTDRVSPGGLVDEIMDGLLVTDFADRYPNQVSHGQRQRAAIARSIALKPRFLLLDEITSALDVEHVGIVLDYLQSLRNQGVGIVLITHLIGFARDAADQIIFMEHGHIVEVGTPSILSDPQTARLRDFLSLVSQRSKSNGLLQSGYVIDSIQDALASSAGATALDHSSALHQLAACGGAAPFALLQKGLSEQEEDFVADALLQQLRDGKMPTERDASIINRYPFVDRLRQKVEGPDSTWILASIDADEPEMAGLLISLLRKLSTRPEVVETLQRHWQTGTPALKSHLLWRILDTPDLPWDRRQEILTFILDHWSVFNRISSAFLGAAENIIPNALKRLADPEFPSGKKWAYLCRVVEPAADKQAAKALLTLNLNHEDEFMQHTARTLIDRFFPTSPPEMDASSGAELKAVETLKSLRKGEFPTEQAAEVLDRCPVIEELRKNIEEGDLTWLTNPVAKTRPKLQGLFVSLLRKYSTRPEIQTFLKGLWATAETHVRTRILFRLADSPDLSPDWKKQLLEFVLHEPAAFEATCVAFYGGYAENWEMTFDRLADTEFPTSKRWLYLSQLLVGKDSTPGWPREKAVHYLKIAAQDQDSFTSQAAVELLNTLEPKAHDASNVDS